MASRVAQLRHSMRRLTAHLDAFVRLCAEGELFVVDPSLKEELTCDGTMTVTLNQHDEVRVRPALLRAARAARCSSGSAARVRSDCLALALPRCLYYALACRVRMLPCARCAVPHSCCACVCRFAACRRPAVSPFPSKRFVAWCPCVAVASDRTLLCCLSLPSCVSEELTEISCVAIRPAPYLCCLRRSSFCAAEGLHADRQRAHQGDHEAAARGAQGKPLCPAHSIPSPVALGCSTSLRALWPVVVLLRVPAWAVSCAITCRSPPRGLATHLLLSCL